VSDTRVEGLTAVASASSRRICAARALTPTNCQLSKCSARSRSARCVAWPPLGRALDPPGSASMLPESVDYYTSGGGNLYSFLKREQAPKGALAGHKEEGTKKDTPAPLWAGAYTRRVGSERRQTRRRSHSQTQAIQRIHTPVLLIFQKERAPAPSSKILSKSKSIHIQTA
jgi:hypothetical protein